MSARPRPSSRKPDPGVVHLVLQAVLWDGVQRWVWCTANSQGLRDGQQRSARSRVSHATGAEPGTGRSVRGTVGRARPAEATSKDESPQGACPGTPGTLAFLGNMWERTGPGGVPGARTGTLQAAGEGVGRVRALALTGTLTLLLSLSSSKGPSLRQGPLPDGGGLLLP